MANFLDDITSYNAKASLAIALAVKECRNDTANLMSSLKTTANDTSLSEPVRLQALTALINVGGLLDIPLPPYFPVTTTYATTQSYVGIHNDLSGLQGGAAGEYYHLTAAERTSILNKAGLSDITFANLQGVYTQNNSLNTAINSKQDQLNAPVGNYFVKISGTTISYDNSTYLTSATLASTPATGQLSGTFGNPILSNAAVIAKVLTGWNGSVSPASITSSDSILTALQKLNANINDVIANPAGVSTVALTMPSSVFTYTSTPSSGAVMLSASFNTQTANRFFAGPTTGAAAIPTFRALVAADLPSGVVTPGTYGSGAAIPVITVDTYGRVTGITTAPSASGGQVNTVMLTGSGIFSLTQPGSTPTDVVWNIGLATQTPNFVFAGPATGSTPLAPGFRALVAADIPSLTISKISGLQSALDSKMTYSLNDGEIWIGNKANAPINHSLTGDVLMTREGVVTIQPEAVTFAKMQNITSGNLLGRYDASSPGSIQQISLDPLSFNLDAFGVLSLATPVAPVINTKGSLITYRQSIGDQVQLYAGTNGQILIPNNNLDDGLEWVDVTGDITLDTANPSGAATISAGAVTLAKMANLAANSFIGNNTGSSATPIALTTAQATAMLNVFDTASTTKGLVPGSNSLGSTYFLCADGTWQPVTGTGTVTTVSVVSANGFAGTVANATTTPAITLSTTITGVLKGNGTAISTAIAGTDVVTPGTITQTSGAGSGLEMATARILGRTTAGTGPIEAISAGATLTLSGGSLGINLGNLNTWTAKQTFSAGIQLNGATSGYVQINAPAVAGTQTYTLPTGTPSGSNQFLTATTGGVLSWASPVGTTTNAVTFNNSGSGAASGTTFDGSVARTISYNTIGAQALNANLTGLSALSYSSGTPFVKMTAAGTFALDTNTYVTNVSFTGGLISVATPSTTPAFTVAGTQGGIVYFTSGSTWASTSALDQGELLVGGGTGSPSTINTGATDTILISNGPGFSPSWSTATYLVTTSANRLLYSSANNVIDEIVAPSSANTYLKWDGSSFTWDVAGGGGGSGTVSTGTIGQLAYYTGTTTVASFSAANSIIYGNNSNNVAALPYGTEANKYLRVNATGTALIWDTAGTGTVTSVGLTMPAAFNVSIPTITTSGTFAVTAAGTAAQYIRGDGQLALLPTSGGGGGTSVSYYLNGSVSQGINNYKQMSKVPVIGLGTDFTLTNTTGAQVMAEFLTDANDPSLLNIPAGAWTINLFFSVNNANAAPSFYVELLKYDGATFTPIATSPSEDISNGTAINYYSTSIALSSTALSVTDRLAIRVYVNTNGNRTVTLHTEDSHLAQVVTTFSTGITSLNGLNTPVQFFANGSSGLAPAFVSSTSTHTLNIPLASTASVTAGLISNTDYTNFSNKISNPMTALGDIIYGGALGAPTALGIGSVNQVLTVSAGGIPTWTNAGTGDVIGPSSSLDGNFAVFSGLGGKTIAEPAAASLTTGGRATFNDGVDVGVSNSATGTLVFRNNTTSATTTFQSSTSQSSNASYVWPQAQATSSGLVLTNDGAGNLSWTATGTGNVTLAGTNPFTGANSFSSSVTVLSTGTFTLTTPGTTGTTRLVSSATVALNQIITFPNATGTVALINTAQTFTGNQNFQSGNITIGGNGTSGVFRIGNNSSTGVTILASAATTAAQHIVTLPNAAGTVALADVSQTFSAAQFFNAQLTINGNGVGGSFRIQSPSSTGYTSLTTNATTAAQHTVTFPNAAGTVPLLGLAQNWSALQTFQNGISLTTAGTFTTAASVASTFSGSAAFNSSTTFTSSATFNSGVARFGNTSNTFFYTIVGSAIGAGRQLTLPLITTNDTFAVLGLAQSFSAAQTFNGGITMGAAITGAASQDVFNTTSTTINFAGAATTLAIGNTATAAQTVNMFTASTGASTYNFATGATANATTKTINIGTGGAAGSTTNITFGTSATTNLRFFGSANTSGKPTVTGSRGGNAALASFLTALSNLGLITDSTTA